MAEGLDPHGEEQRLADEAGDEKWLGEAMDPKPVEAADTEASTTPALPAEGATESVKVGATADESEAGSAPIVGYSRQLNPDRSADDIARSLQPLSPAEKARVRRAAREARRKLQ